MIILDTNIMITKILKPTRAKFFCDVVVGDVLCLELPLVKIKRSDTRLSATNIKCSHMTQLHKRADGEKEVEMSINSLLNRLESFEVVEVVG